MVWQGQLAVEYLEGQESAGALLGQRDLVLVEPGQRFRLRNAGARRADRHANSG
jgi:hypothetical protein